MWWPSVAAMPPSCSAPTTGHRPARPRSVTVPRRRVCGGLRVAGLLAAEAAAVAALHALEGAPGLAVGWQHPGRWLVTAPAEDVVAAALRTVALAAAWWLLTTTGAHVAARLLRLPTLSRLTRGPLLPAVRRLVDRSLTVGLVGSSLVVGSPALASPDLPGGPGGLPTSVPRPTSAATAGFVPPGLRPLDSPRRSAPLADPDDPGVARTLPREQTSPAPATDPPPATADACGRTAPVGAGVGATHRVVPGDSLWDVATAVVAEPTRRRNAAPGHGDVAVYWQRLIAANRGRLRSGDPDLIYPGEVLVLPPLAPPG